MSNVLSKRSSRVARVVVAGLSIYLVGCSSSAPNHPYWGKGNGAGPRTVSTYATSPDVLRKNLGKGYVRWDFESDGHVWVAAFDKSPGMGMTAVARGTWRDARAVSAPGAASGVPVADSTPATGGSAPLAGGATTAPIVAPADPLADASQILVNCNRLSFLEDSLTTDEPTEVFTTVANSSSGGAIPRKVKDFLDSSDIAQEQMPLEISNCSGKDVVLDKKGDEFVVRDDANLRIMSIKNDGFLELKKELPKNVGQFKLTHRQHSFRNSLVVEDRANEVFPRKTFYVIPKVAVEEGTDLSDGLVLTQDLAEGVVPSGRRTRPANMTVPNDPSEWRSLTLAGVEFGQREAEKDPVKKVTILKPGDFNAPKKVFKLKLEKPAGDEYTLYVRMNYLASTDSKIAVSFKMDVDRDNQVVKTYDYQVSDKVPKAW